MHPLTITYWKAKWSLHFVFSHVPPTIQHYNQRIIQEASLQSLRKLWRIAVIASTEAMTHYRELTSGERKWDTSKECTVLLWLAKRYVSGQCSEEIKPVD